MAVTKRVRFEVLKRDNFTCRYCHKNTNELEVDHVVPVALGGEDIPENLVAACKDCNRGKSSINPDEALVKDVSEKALSFGKALQEALRKQMVDIEWESNYVEDLRETWEAETEAEEGYYLPLPDSWRSTARYWASLRIPYSIFEYAFSVAKDRVDLKKIPARVAFRYAVGIVNNKLEDASYSAREEMEDGA